MGLVTTGLAADTTSFALIGQKDTPAASGTATLAGTTLTISARGLKPNAVCTVWLVNMSPTMIVCHTTGDPTNMKDMAEGLMARLM